MAIVRILLILLLAGTGACLVFQNRELLVITLIGTPMQPLPLGVLLLLAIGLGFVCGIILLFLLQTKAAPRRPNASVRFSRRKSFDLKNLFNTNPFQSKSSSKSSKSRFSQPGVKTGQARTQRFRTGAGSDWHEVPSRDWVDPPVSEYEPTSSSSFRDSVEIPPDDRPSGRSPNRDRAEERVVDADYRVLRQPYSPPPPDEEWDDDFFKDER
jgi:hypothetical protein